MTRISKLLYAALLGLLVSTATGCPDDNNNEEPDLSTPKADAGLDLSGKD